MIKANGKMRMIMLGARLLPCTVPCAMDFRLYLQSLLMILILISNHECQVC